jgi:hypothetical protein
MVRDKCQKDGAKFEISKIQGFAKKNARSSFLGKKKAPQFGALSMQSKENHSGKSINPNSSQFA